jgi:hypothetical protein
MEIWPMALKAVLESLEGVDDAIKPFYTEAEGKFTLAVEGVDDHPEVANLRNAYTRTKEDREKARTEAATLKSQIEELKKGAPDTAATQAKLAQMQEQLEAATAQAQEWQGRFTAKARDEALVSSLQAAGIVNPAFVKAAQAMLAPLAKLGDDGTAYVETPMGPKVLGDFVKSWAAGDGKDFVAPPSGGGAAGSKGGGGGARTMARAEFEGLSPDAKMKAVREGTTLTD